MILDKFTGLLIDFHGTLTPENIDFTPLRKKIIKDLPSFSLGKDFSINNLIERSRNSELEKINSVITKHQYQFENQNFINIKIYPDTPEFLSFTADKFICAIVSNNFTKTVSRVLSENNLIFKGEIIGRDKVRLPKPDPEMGLYFFNKYNLKPKDCALIGDSDNDILFGRNLKVFTIVIKHPDSKNLATLKANLEIKSLKELITK